MKRLHVHVAVDDLDRSVAYYRALFDAEPTVLKADYAKWALADPAINFAISDRDRAAGVDHLGIQVESAAELEDVTRRLAAAEQVAVPESDAVCCYATSEKTWSRDPSGVVWETFWSHGQSRTYGRTQPRVVAQIYRADG